MSTERDDIGNLAETASTIGRPIAWFYKNWPLLVRHHDFPQPVPGPGRRWNLAKVRAWRDREQTKPPTPAVYDDALAAELRDRSRRIAAGLQ